jgi:primosomal protein N' (replication factor Y)
LIGNEKTIFRGAKTTLSRRAQLQDMSNNAILRVAINAPLSRLFDYLPPTDQVNPALLPGCRVRVPFGSRQVVGVIMEIATESDLPRSKLKHATAVLDSVPVLSAQDLSLIGFTSDYYHHPLGEVISTALPVMLRRGGQIDETVETIRLTEEGINADLPAFRRRAPRQFELVEILHNFENGVDAETLEQHLPGWRRQKAPLMERGWITVTHEKPQVAAESVAREHAGPTLNADQQNAVDAILKTPTFCVTLLDGVTGSGKTEVYLRLMQNVLAAGKQVLILVPEIGLTPQFVTRLQERLGREPALLHSGLSNSARLAAWRRARNGLAALVIGTRSAVFAPLKSPGLIIIDEEHDSSLKQQEGLRYSARDLGIVRAKQLDIPIILGSATPSLESLQRCRDGAYQRIVLPTRAGGAIPPKLRLIDTSPYFDNDGLSPPLIEAMHKHLDASGQVLLFLNRRGFAPTLICSGCGHIAQCARCDARLTVHSRESKLLCHHCGSGRALDDTCPECGGNCRPLGHGTERLEETLQEQFPAQVISRIDSDSVQHKGTMDEALNLATSGEANILVGTQMLSKGHHFPHLTLVGVINADQGLFGTDFRSSERMAQSLVQVAGRAGREERPGEVLIQTAFPQHAFWQTLFGGGYPGIAEAELGERELAGWPPFSRLVLLRASAHKRDDARRLLERARQHAQQAGVADIRILGPVSAAMERKAGRYRAQLLLQSGSRSALHQLLRVLQPALEADPLGRRARWSIDVDPIELF